MLLMNLAHPKPSEECGAGPPAPSARLFWGFFQIKEETPLNVIDL